MYMFCFNQSRLHFFDSDIVISYLYTKYVYWRNWGTVTYKSRNHYSVIWKAQMHFILNQNTRLSFTSLPWMCLKLLRILIHSFTFTTLTFTSDFLDTFPQKVLNCETVVLRMWKLQRCEISHWLLKYSELNVRYWIVWELGCNKTCLILAACCSFKI